MKALAQAMARHSLWILILIGSAQFAWADDRAWLDVKLDVVDFRRHNRLQSRFWAMPISGQTADGAWKGALTVRDVGERKRAFVGRIPKGLTKTRLFFRAPRGHIVVFEGPQEGRSRSGEAIDLATVNEDITGRMLFYPAAYVVVKVVDGDGRPVPDANVRSVVRSAAVEEFQADYHPLKDETGSYISPGLVAPFAHSDITVRHATHGSKYVSVGGLNRDETRTITVKLDGSDSPKATSTDLPELFKESEKITTGRPLSEKEQSLQFGANVNGLCAAMLLSPMQAAYSPGELVEVTLFIKNASDRVIQVGMRRQLGNVFLEATDDEGRRIQREPVRALGPRMNGHAHCRLNPGEVFSAKASTIRFGDAPSNDGRRANATLVVAKGDTCHLRFKIPLPGIQIQDGKGNLLVPARGEWVGTLTTAPTSIQIK